MFGIDPLINVRFMTILISCKMRFQLFLRQALYLRKLPIDHCQQLDSYKGHSGLHRVKFSAPYGQNCGSLKLFSSQPAEWDQASFPLAAIQVTASGLATAPFHSL